MNYTDLKANVQDICENEFTDDQLDMFTQQAEQLIFNSVQLPVLQKISTGTLTASTNTYTLPTDFLYMYDFNITVSNTKTPLLNKDVSFIRDAYPDTSVEAAPVHYAILSDTQLILGPVPDSNYATELTYGAYPTSIVSAGTTWLGDQFDSALLNGTLVEAIRFMKGEADLVQMYNERFLLSVQLLKNLGDGKLRQDTYRSGQFRSPVT